MNKILTIIILGWLVTWNVHNHYPVSCCKDQPFYIEDEYGVEYQNPCFQQLVACWETITTPKRKMFESIEAAQEFIRAGEDRLNDYYGPAVSDFKIQELIY